MSDRQLNSAQVSRARWWLDDLPPLDGRLRFLFYAAMFWLAVINLKSPLAGTEFYAQTDPRMFRPYGLLEWLGVEYLSVDTVKNIVNVVAIAWVAAAIGFGGRISTLICALGALFLQGMFLGSNALNHYFFLPVYTLLALCVASHSADRWSVDFWIRKTLGNERLAPGLGSTGLPRKLVLIATVGFYFAAGIAKLFHSGLAWADGQTIQYFCELRRDQYPLANVIVDRLWLAQIGACGTLLLEVGSPLALFSRGLRHAWIVGLIGMHVVIRYAMGPAYWPNVLCLLLLVDWGWILGAMRRWANYFSNYGADDPSPSSPRSSSFPRSAGVVRAGRWLGAATLTTAFSTAVFGIFWWPLTNVYMYCSYFSLEKDIRAGNPRLEYYDPVAVQKIACEFQRTQPPREVAEYFSFQVALRLAKDGQPPRYLYDSLGVATWKQWVLTVIAPVLIEDLCAKPVGSIEYEPYGEDYPAQRFLRGYAAVLRDHLSPELLAEYDRVELVFPFADERGMSAELLPPEVREEYAAHDPKLPPKLRMTPLASVPLQQDQ